MTGRGSGWRRSAVERAICVVAERKRTGPAAGSSSGAVTVGGGQPGDYSRSGDVSHISKPAQFDTAEQVIRGAKVDRVFYVPGEHDTSMDGGALYRQHFGKGTLGGG